MTKHWSEDVRTETLDFLKGVASIYDQLRKDQKEIIDAAYEAGDAVRLTEKNGQPHDWIGTGIRRGDLSHAIGIHHFEHDERKISFVCFHITDSTKGGAS